MTRDVPLYKRNYRDALDAYCHQNGIDVGLVFDPDDSCDSRYDRARNVVHLGASATTMPDWAGYYLLYRAVVEAHQVLRPDDFSQKVARSAQYAVFPSGKAAKWVDGRWKGVDLNAAYPHDADYWQRAAENMPHRVEAGEIAREEAYDMLVNDCARDNLHSLHYMSSPHTAFDAAEYERLFDRIDAMVDPA